MTSRDKAVEAEWRNLALQFDGHRIDALSMLRYAVRNIEEYATVRDILREPLQTIKAFLAAPPLSGEKVLAARIAASAAEGGEAVAWRDVIAERQRQISAEGWTPEHDDVHASHELRRAAACYMLGNGGNWPWDWRWWKPTTDRRNLVKAAALLIAEIERLDREGNRK